MAEHPGFLKAIIAEPAEDVHRLVYADWLGEHEEPERAEFIRVQVEIARMDEAGEGEIDPDEGHTCWLTPCPVCALVDKYQALRLRERELLNAHIGRWTKDFPAAIALSVISTDCWRRGFVVEIICTLADWCGTECQRCEGEGCPYCGGEDRDYHTMCDTCPDCHGTGRVDVHGPALVQKTPLEHVALADLEPGVIHTPSGDVWVFPERARVLGCGLENIAYLHWPTRDLALEARSEACLAWAKSFPVRK